MAQIVTITNPLTGQPAQVDQLEHTAQEIDDAIARALPGGEIDITLQQITGATNAAEYSATATYAIGDYCTHDGKLYRCTTAITEPEAWTEAHWTETTVGSELTAIYTALQNINASGAGAHNAIYRGKYLGASVTAEQYAAIAAGTFDDLYIGDYWMIGGVNYRIAAFDYYLTTGDTACNTHHVTVVPDTGMYDHVMNDSNVTTGGYVGSKMYTTGLSDAKTTINNAFGSAHILTHRQFLRNAVNNGKPSGSSWYDSTVELMTEQNVYGGKVFGAGNNGSTVPALQTVDKSQYPLFAFRPDMISNRKRLWLRDVVSATRFSFVNGNGYADSADASYSCGVRPAFSIKA